ncbi:MAG: DUF2959 family protein [Parvularculaceae bacterium]|nr:DUF2959 family protein [Parvularculaceae bacterium]
MFRTLTITAMLALTGCASAVYDSLERRGVDAKIILSDRVEDARDDAAAAATKIEAAAGALAAAKGFEGPALARQIGMARANAQDAAVAAQDLRLSTDTVGASGERYFQEWEEEIGLYQTPTEREAAAARLKSQAEAHRKLGGALSAASLRLSPALTILNDEIAILRKNPTSGVVAASRAARIDAASKASAEAAASLRSAGAEADRFLTALNFGG